MRSEADTQLRAGRARSQLHVDGSGVTVGVLSDSYDVDPAAATTAYDDVRSGDLPGPGNPCGRTTPVQVVAEFEPDGGSGTDEGRAMLQGVHDLAPGARLAFATAVGGPDAFAANIKALARHGARVIVDDISYLDEPFFQAGVIDQAVSSVVRQGVAYFSSAGNSNLAPSWETPATRLGPCPTLSEDPRPGPGKCVGFNAAGTDTTATFTVDSGGSVQPVLQWAEPVGGVADDFDLYLVDASTGAVLMSSTEDQGQSRTPVEWLSWTNTASSAATVGLVIKRHAGTGTPRLKVAYVSASGVSGVEYSRSQGGDIVGPSVFGHNGGEDTISVAAVPYDDSRVVEPYSARGPVTHYFGPVTSLRMPAAPLPAPQVIHAPDVAASDGTATTFFGDFYRGVQRFWGTSAAAPAAAAVATLMRSANSRLSPAQVRAVLRATAARVGVAPATAVGAGLVDAYRAVGLVAPAPRPTVTRTKGLPRAVKVWFIPGVRAGAAPASGFVASCRQPRGRPSSVSRSGGSTAPLVVTGLARGRAYACTVRARTAYGLGAQSPPGRSVVVTGVPSRPTAVRVTPGRRAAFVTFRAPSNTGGLRLTGFTATCTPTGRGRARSRSGDTTQLRVGRLSPRSRYRCVVVAENLLGQSRPSRRSAAFRPQH